jgi:hypothetical protein
MHFALVFVPLESTPRPQRDQANFFGHSTSAILQIFHATISTLFVHAC